MVLSSGAALLGNHWTCVGLGLCIQNGLYRLVVAGRTDKSEMKQAEGKENRLLAQFLFSFCSARSGLRYMIRPLSV